MHDPFATMPDDDEASLANGDTAAGTLPVSLVQTEGVRNRLGNLSFALPVLARSIELFARYKDNVEPLTFRYGNGSFEVVQRPGEFISSIKSIARSVYQRLFKIALLRDKNIVVHRDSDPGEDDPPELSDVMEYVARSPRQSVPTFDTFYEMVRKIWQRQIQKKQFVLDLGYAASEKHVKGKGRDKFGKRLTLLNTPLEDAWEAPPDPPLSMVLCTVEPSQEALDANYVRVASYMEEAVAYEFELHRQFETACVWRRGARRQQVVKDFLSEQQEWARSSVDAELTISIGAFRPEEALPTDERIRDTRAVFLPYFIAEIDGSTLERSRQYAEALLSKLEERGADLNAILVAYSGNRSFHVRIPAGMLGNPVFRTTHDARKIVAEFFRTLSRGIEGDDGPMWRVLDKNAFSPNAKIRMMGSRHPKTGRYCVGVSGSDFKYSGTHVYNSGQAVYEPWRWEREASLTGSSKVPWDPRTEPVCPGLVWMLRSAEESVRIDNWARGYGDVAADSRGIIRAIENGVREGESPHPDIAGRNEAASRYSLYLIQRNGEVEGWALIQAWNRMCEPPLPQRELEKTFKSATRYIRRRSNGRTG